MSASSSTTTLEARANEGEVELDDEGEEFDPVLSFRQHLEDDLNESDNSDEESALQVGHKRKRVHQVKLPAPPEFKPLTKPEHEASIHLPEPFGHVDTSPINLFRLFFSDTMVNSIILNTNLYAKNNGADFDHPWKDIDRDELVIWIAFTIYHGLHRTIPIEKCWNQDAEEPIHEISRYMSVMRYKQIKRCLHVSNTDDSSDMYFSNVEPLLSHIRDTSKQLYTPSSNISIDEMTVRFSGGVHTVDIKNKSTPESFKILSLSDAGYTYTFLPISRIIPSHVTKVPGLTQTGCLVNHLAQQLPYARLSFNIYMDNYFSSIKLFQHFRDIGIGACGAVKDQERIPKELHVDKRTKVDWDTRSGVVRGGVLAVFWQDNGPVRMLTTIHGIVGDEWEIPIIRRRPRETSINSTKVQAIFGDSLSRELKIPKLVDDYNYFMGEVDIAHQLRSSYDTQQPTRRNWMPLFYWLLDTAITNSYLISRKAGSPLNQYGFRHNLVWELIAAVHHKDRNQHKAPEDQPRPRITKNYKLSTKRFARGDHFAEWRERRSTCFWCSWLTAQQIIEMNHKSPNQSQVWCKECNVPLCVNKSRNCFSSYHSPNSQ